MMIIDKTEKMSSRLRLPVKKLGRRPSGSMKRVLWSIALCLAVALAGCVAPHGGSDALRDRPAIGRIEARGRLLVGSTGDYRPLT